MHDLEHLLQQCNSDDIPELVKDVKNKLSQRCIVLNADQSALLKLPAELIIEIGKLVMELKGLGRSDKQWFKLLLPLLQTCTKLRTELRSLRSEHLFCWIVT